MKQHIIHLLHYNEKANHTLLDSILQLPEKEEALALFSHVIAAQDIWLGRVAGQEDNNLQTWQGTPYDAGDIRQQWERSIKAWIDMITSLSEQQLEADTYFIRKADGKRMKAKTEAIALQINYHSMHHRAQINKMIRAQGFVPPVTDYILGAISEAG